MADQPTLLRRLALGAVAVGLLIAAFSAWRLAHPAPGFRGTTFVENEPAPPIELVDHEGGATTLEEFRGRPVLLFFGYTHCPDVCPTTLSRIAGALEDAGRAGDETAVLFVTTDPERDTPAVLADYVRRFGPNFVGLTGDSTALARAMDGYGAHVFPPAPEDVARGHDGEHGGADARSQVHSAAVYGIDREGRLRVVISSSATEEELRDDVKTLAKL